MVGQKLVSIGLAVYNGGDFIDQAIDSLLSQKNKNIELIISDNGSTDKTEEICCSYVNKDNRVKYYRVPQNMGGPFNFKNVLDLANGEYFMWAAHDDLWHPEFISKLVVGLEENPNCNMAGCNVQNINTQGDLLEQNPSMIKFSDKNHISALANFLREPEVHGKANLVYGLYRTKFLREMYDKGIKMNATDWGTDCIFLFGCLCRTNLYFCDDYLFYKRDVRTKAAAPSLEKISSDEFTFPPLSRAQEYVDGFIRVSLGTRYEVMTDIIMNLRKDLYLKQRPGVWRRLLIIIKHLFSCWGWSNMLFKLRIINSQPGLNQKISKIREMFLNY